MERKIALVYIRNGKATAFPVRDIQHAIALADNIAESDLLNDTVDFNMFEVFYCDDELNIGEAWESEEGENFDEFWGCTRDGAKNV